MPRKNRFWEPGRCYHIMMRGIDGRHVFNDDKDRSRFLLLLQEAGELHHFRIHAFCLMTNHIHLLLEPLKGGLTEGIHRFTSRYAQYFNRQHKKKGYVFQGRFRSILVEDGMYMKRVIRYIHLNPVEAKIVTRPQDFRWSSHNGYFLHAEYVWLETDRILSYFGQNRESAILNFTEFMASIAEASQDLGEIERALRAGVYGSEGFKKAFVPTTFNKTSNDLEKVSLEELIDVICARLGISKEQMYGEEKTRAIVNAREILARATQLLRNFSFKDVGKILNKHQGTVSRLAMRGARNPNLQVVIEEITGIK